MKRLQAVVFLWLFVFGVFLDGHAAGREEQNPYQAGIAALMSGDAQRAVELLTQTISERPQDYRYYNDRGIAYKRCGNLEMALADYSKALELKPGYTQALNNRGLVFLEQGFYDKAIGDFAEALKHGGLESKIYTNLGLARARQGDHLAAIKDFDKAFSYRPLDYRSFLFMAESLEKTGSNERALKTYQLARGLVNETQAKELIERRIAALESATFSSKTSPAVVSSYMNNFKPAFEGVGRPKQNTEKQALPIRDIARAKPAPEVTIVPRKALPEPEKTPVATMDALNNVSRKRTMEKLTPASAEIYRQGLHFLEKSDTTKALVRFEDTRQLERRNKNLMAVAWLDLEIGRIYSKMGDHSKAESYFSEALKLFEGSKARDQVILVLTELAVNQRNAGRMEKALPWFSKAKEIALSEGYQLLAAAISDIADGKSIPEKTKAGGDREKPTDSAPAQQTSQQLSNETGSKPAVKAEAPSRTEQHQVSKARGATQSSQEDQTGSVRTMSNQPSQTQVKPDARNNYGSVTGTEPLKILKGIGTSRPELIGKSNSSIFRSPSLVQTQPSTIPMSTVGPSTPGRPLGGQPGSREDKPDQVTNAGVEASPAGKHRSLEKLGRMTGQTSPDNLKGRDRDSREKLLRKDLIELRELRKRNDEPQMIEVLQRISELYLQDRNFEKALLSLSAALALREKLFLYRQIERLLQMRASARESLGHFAEALEDYTRALAFSESSDRRLVNTLEQRSQKMAAAIGIDSKGIRDAFKLLWKARSEGDTLGETEALLAIGRIYDNSDHNAEALSYYERSSASLLANRAHVFEKMGKEQLAQTYYTQALEALRNLDYSGYITIIRKSKIAGNISQH